MLIKSTAGTGHAPRRGELTNKRISGIVGPKTAASGFGRGPFGPHRPVPAPSPPLPHQPGVLRCCETESTSRSERLAPRRRYLRGGRRHSFDNWDRRVPASLPAGHDTCTRAHQEVPLLFPHPPPLNPHPLPGRRRAARLFVAFLQRRLITMERGWRTAAGRVRLPPNVGAQNGLRVNSDRRWHDYGRFCTSRAALFLRTSDMCCQCRRIIRVRCRIVARSAAVPYRGDLGAERSPPVAACCRLLPNCRCLSPPDRRY